MTSSPYPEVNTNADLLNAYKEIVRLRDNEDIPDFSNLTQRFVRGRTTSRVPSMPSDVLATDSEGDIVTDAPNGFEYKLVNNNGTLVWDRRALNIAW